eukprot:TRINITY_DN29318_c0_g1_i1.p1 TRINITY_DN29318_c0_g1~~TRINITY_DN29318_c0_g1_i1.p1  ORF type:complete len:286 (+),score=58.65 TRINITY_DN29318_c0_g1_i1:94-951(+)
MTKKLCVRVCVHMLLFNVISPVTAIVLHGASLEDVHAKSNVTLQEKRAAQNKNEVAAHTANNDANKAPCNCETSNPAWKKTERTKAKCVFIDLGANNGNSLDAFLKNTYGNVADCPNGGEWEAYLVEANPRFTSDLENWSSRYPGKVTNFGSTAAYMCNGKTTFYLQDKNVGNYWGSSMSKQHQDVQNGKHPVSVLTKNLMQIIHESTIQADKVIVKMDIEGAEFDIVPCLAKYPELNLLDSLFVEVHDASWGMVGNTREQLQQALDQLKSKGVSVPDYSSATFL